VRAIVTGTYPIPTIVATAEEEGVDLIMMSTRGRGGLDRLMMGSAAQRVVEQTRLPVFLLPVRETPGGVRDFS
jgi:nucleotide-binding universal stress UspA family protein